MDGHTAAAAANPGRVMDPLLRRVGDENRAGHGPVLHLTPRGPHKVRGY
jgi:hypothetical protein